MKLLALKKRFQKWDLFIEKYICMYLIVTKFGTVELFFMPIVAPRSMPYTYWSVISKHIISCFFVIIVCKSNRFKNFLTLFCKLLCLAIKQRNAKQCNSPHQIHLIILKMSSVLFTYFKKTAHIGDMYWRYVLAYPVAGHCDTYLFDNLADVSILLSLLSLCCYCC